jgi:3-oxoacyl-[acyl-carrier protein] reductase
MPPMPVDEMTERVWRATVDANRTATFLTLTQDVAAQMGRYNIRANCIAPESILTENNIQRIPDQQKAVMVGEHPSARLGTPEDVAHAALFFASPNAGWITGIVIDVAGGAVMPR